MPVITHVRGSQSNEINELLHIASEESVKLACFRILAFITADTVCVSYENRQKKKPQIACIRGKGAFLWSLLHLNHQRNAVMTFTVEECQS